MSRKQKDLFRLLSARHDGRELSDGEHQELTALLDGDEDAQFAYFQIERMFHDLDGQFLGNCAETVANEYPVKNRAKIIPLFGALAAIAASLVILFMLMSPSGTGNSELLVNDGATVRFGDTVETIAHVVGAENPEWGENNTVEMHSGELKPGLLDLKSGSLDVVFDNGVRFGFEGPVQMDLTSMHRLSLLSGNVVADAPDLAGGLVINTPDGVVLADKATAYLQCFENETLVDVRQGSVRLFSENDVGKEIRRTMTDGESVRIARGASEPIADVKRSINPPSDLLLPPDLENLQYVHYRFDESRGKAVKNHGTVPNADGYLAGISAYPEYPLPRRVPGRFKRALEFSGHGEGMLAELKEFDSDEPGSVAFWIKMEPGTIPGEYENIFTWHMFRDENKSYHDDDAKELVTRIRINPSEADGVVGAVRIEFRNKWICGATDLRDGRWHHVTAVFHRGYSGKTVRHYVDGQLARVSARGQTWFSNKRYEEIGGGTIAVGRVLWPKKPSTLADSDPVGLRGMIDELYVFNQAVLPSHASNLYMKNSPGERVDVSFRRYCSPALAFLTAPVDK